MSVLKFSKALGRSIRQDEPATMAISTWDLLRDAIRSGKTDEALELTEHLNFLGSQNGESLTAFYKGLITRIADLGGEHEDIRSLHLRVLKLSEALGRTTRQDESATPPQSSWDLLRDAIQSGKTDAAIELADHLHRVERENSASLIDLHEGLVTRIANLGGEEQAIRSLHDRAMPRMRSWLSNTPDTLESFQMCTERQRNHSGVVSVCEDAEKYVATYEPCGTLGRLIQKREVGRTKKAYPWSWGKADVPYYCTHCALQWEIIPIELRGYPIRVTLPGAKPGNPCVHVYYRRPESIPEEYFTRVGKTKTTGQA